MILAMIWGSSFILIKKGLQAFSALQVGVIRISFAFLLMLPFAVRHLKVIPLNKYKFLFFNGMIGNLIPAVLFALAVTKLQSSLTGILNAMVPIFTLLFAVFFFNYKIVFLQAIGMIIAFTGSVGLSFIGKAGGFGQMNVYVWLVIVATICYALSLNFIKAYLSGYNSVVITSLSILTVGPLSLIILFSTDFVDKLFNYPGALESLAFLSLLGIFGTAIGLVLYTRLILMTSAVFASTVTFLVPIVAIMWGLLDNEILFPLHFAGMFMILFGIYVINKSVAVEL